MTVREIIAAAIRDFAAHGYDSEQRLDDWVGRLRRAIEAEMRPAPAMEAAMRDALGALYRRIVDNGEVLRAHPTVERFTLALIAPRLRNELDRRIMASANLIRLNRAEAIEKTIRRFSGWATSIPVGGGEAKAREVRAETYKPLASLPFIERRVLIDQGAKLNSSISALLAADNGAIAGRWHSHWRQAGYNYRPEHKARDPDGHAGRENHVYLARDSWARREGLVKAGEAGYMDDIDQPAEKPFCRCRWVYVYALRQLPDEMLTAKGREALEKARAA